MLAYVKEGWKTTVQQPFLLFVLFFYRLGWGLVLYGTVRSTVVPLLHRYPDHTISEMQSQLFLAESQFQVTKTDVTHSYIWLIVILLLIRMILTPLLNAGIFYSLRQTDLNSGYRFFKGIRELGGTYFIYYALQMLLTVAPLYWLIPKGAHILTASSGYETALQALAPYILGFGLYGYFVYMGFMYLQFGKAWSRSILFTLWVTGRSTFTIIGISLTLIVISLLASTLALSVVWIWAGFWTLIFYQAFRFIQSYLDLWTIASQHGLFVANSMD